ncbi:MAG TPA: glycoside hydrolase family 97 catalytic domain-containing protein [Verrucomicrobiae bacterium]|nr:glycoside hydrolase family 97 catalytic domain-containing protein [Verrucomicrobiae bacterium]
MKTFLLLSMAIPALAFNSFAEPLKSPDGHLVVQFKIDGGAPHYAIERDGRIVLQDSRLGLVRDDVDFSTNLQLTGESKIEVVKDHYTILTAKRRVNNYRANRKVFHLQTVGGEKMDIIFQVSDDGVAFRYCFPETNSTVHKIAQEVSSFHFLPGTRAWLQPMQVAKTGFHGSNPAYEEYYQKDIPVGTPSTLHAGWVYPALFRSGDTWLLVSESSPGRNYCGTHLRDQSPDGEYTVALADPRETMDNLPANPHSSLPWLTPWRLIVVGGLKTIAESTLGIDLAGPAKFHSSVKPGKASWSWPLLGDGATKYDVQKKFIDYASQMHWQYCLIDAFWDKQIGYDKIAELVKYAATKNVKIILWYNSAGNWNTVPLSPRDKMLTHESRLAEFKRLKAMGVAGLKIDFFGGDGQPMMDYYQDILQDAAPFGFAINFHGATLPRGWERTYPDLMTMEAIKGEEYITFDQANANEEPVHAPMLPFTRNVFDPMDFTPVALDRINDHIHRRTTSAFELALSVLFVSGIQHYAETPEGMAKAPDYVQEFLRHVPSVWDDTKFLDGFPGKYVVLARKGDGKWFIAGINGEEQAKSLSLDLSELRGAKSGTLITDGNGGNLSFKQEKVKIGADRKFEITIESHGGFVMVLD